MSVDRADVIGIARLARLKVTGDELERLTADLNRILAHIDALASLDASSPQHVGGQQVVAPPPQASSEAATHDLSQGPEAFAPAWRDSFFVVPPLPGLEPVEDRE